MKQLGTLEGGNHFIEVCLDTDNFVWFNAAFGLAQHRQGTRGASHFNGKIVVAAL